MPLKPKEIRAIKDTPVLISTEEPPEEDDLWCRCPEVVKFYEPVYYEVEYKGHWYHGWNCSTCGKLIQTG